MANRISKPKPVVTLYIKLGPISPAMRHAYQLFWKRVIASAKCQVKVDD